LGEKNRAKGKGKAKRYPSRPDAGHGTTARSLVRDFATAGAGISLPRDGHVCRTPPAPLPPPHPEAPAGAS